MRPRIWTLINAGHCSRLSFINLVRETNASHDLRSSRLIPYRTYLQDRSERTQLYALHPEFPFLIWSEMSQPKDGMS